MFCAQEAGKSNVEENGQNIGNNRWAMNVKKAKPVLLR